MEQKIKAFGFYQPGDRTKPPEFVSENMPKPSVTGKDLLVEVKAISVNPTDLRTRDAKKDDDDSFTIVGRDVAGIVVEIGEDCELFEVGDEVFYAGTNNRPGGHSELHVVDERIVGKKPERLDFAHAAALPLTSLTAWEALFDRLGVSHEADENKDKSILIIGAAGGVGSIAVQIAKLVGLKVIGTASRQETSDWAIEHGADIVINHHEELMPQLQEQGLKAVDYIFCLSDPDGHMANMAETIAPQGKICSILPLQKPLDMQLFAKSVTFAYELMYTRSVYQTADMLEQHKALNRISEWADESSIVSTLANQLKPLNADTLKEAYEQLLTNRTIGKIVVEGPFEG